MMAALAFDYLTINLPCVATSVAIVGLALSVRVGSTPVSFDKLTRIGITHHLLQTRKRNLKLLLFESTN